MVTVDEFLAQPVPQNYTRLTLGKILQTVYGESLRQYLEAESGIMEAMYGRRPVSDTGVST